jgi:hypothetical protein
MSELRRVSGPPSRLERHPEAIVAVVVAAIILVIVKPWGQPASAPIALASPTASPAPTASPVGGPRVYDFRAYGTNQPPPSWELWPAGTLASYTFAMRIALTTEDAPAPTASGDASPSAAATPTHRATPSASGPAPAPPAVWPTIRIPAGNELDIIGINRPLGFAVSIERLVRVDDDGTSTIVQTVLAPSPWPDHFLIIGITDDPAVGSMTPWPAGRYLLDLSIEPGGARRTVEIIVESPPVRPTEGSPAPMR